MNLDVHPILHLTLAGTVLTQGKQHCASARPLSAKGNFVAYETALMASSDLTIRPATLDDVDELVDVYFRAFHPVSPFMVHTFPDTPQMRSWWAQLHRYAILDPEVTLMIVTSKSRNGAIVAMARRRYFPTLPHQATALEGPDADFVRPDGDLSAGSWTLCKMCPDIDAEMFEAMMGFMAQAHTRLMTGKRHFLIELVGVVHEAQGQGAGRLLLEEVNQRADDLGLEVFVETNNLVVDFYEKMGYKILDRLMMPGEIEYEEFNLIRLPLKAR